MSLIWTVGNHAITKIEDAKFLMLVQVIFRVKFEERIDLFKFYSAVSTLK